MRSRAAIGREPLRRAPEELEQPRHFVVHGLAMDDAIDQMNQTAKVITLFELRSFEGHMQSMGDIIVQAARLMVDAVPLLSSLNRESARLNSLTEEILAPKIACTPLQPSRPTVAISMTSPLV